MTKHRDSWEFYFLPTFQDQPEFQAAAVTPKAPAEGEPPDLLPDGEGTS